MSGNDLQRLADQQAALRRVATLVARGAPPEEVFAAAVKEVGQLLGVDLVSMSRYEPDRTLTFVTTWGRLTHFLPVDTRLALGGKNLNTIVFETGRPARVDSYSDASGSIGVAVHDGGVRSAAGAPIVVEGRLWGTIAAGLSGEGPLPADTEARLADFTELLATAIANAESRAGLARLAEEQAALRRVATLVARGIAPEEVFAAVADEVGRLLAVDFAVVGRYEPGKSLTVLATSGTLAEHFPVGHRWSLGGKNLATMLFETERPARLEGYPDAFGPLGDKARDAGIRSSVGAPIVVEGRVWGVVTAGLTAGGRSLPPDTEARLGSFTELVATAIANAESRSALAASRARIVAAADEARRRIERDLHDGTQQQLVSLMLELKAAPSEAGELRAELARAARGLEGVLKELQEIARGIHPAILSRGGLGSALRALAGRSAVPVELHLGPVQNLPEHVAVAAYYVVSEALTNAAKHARASVVNVELDAADGSLQLAIRDDGIGGADPRRGSGLVGLSDRVEAFGGTLQVTSPAGAGTMLLIQIPLEGQTNVAPGEP